MVPRPAKDLSCGLREPHDRLLSRVGHLGVGACPSVQGVVAFDAILGIDRVVVLVPEEAVRAAAPDHRIVAQTPVLGVVAAPAGERVVGIRAGEGVRLGGAEQVLHAREGVRALSCGGVGGERGNHRGEGGRVGGGVGPGPAVDGVVAPESLYGVVAAARADDVVARGAGDRVGVGSTGYGAAGSWWRGGGEGPAVVLA